MNVNQLIEYLNEYIWTELEISPEDPNGQDLSEWEPEKGWITIFFKNFGDNNRQIAMHRARYVRGMMSSDVSPDNSEIYELLKVFFKKRFRITISYETTFVVDLSFVQHDPNGGIEIVE